MGSNSPKPKASVTLPPEILGKILEYIPTDSEGQFTLIACALVATRWTGPSQRRLFSSVSIHNGNYERWMNGVVLSGSKTHLLGYVRSLRHYRYAPEIASYLMRNLPKDSGEYLSTLYNIRSLELTEIRIEDIGEAGLRTCFSAFRETLTDLTLRSFITSLSTFVTLVDYFPNITTLRLSTFAVDPDEGPVPPLSRPLRGKIYLWYIHPYCVEFFGRLAELDLEYEELILGSYMETKLLESILQLSPSTIKYLRLIADFQCEWAVTICHLRQLRELELVAVSQSSTYQTLLSSITSTELRKIIFLTRGTCDWRMFLPQEVPWVSIDEQLCELVDRLRATGHRHTLEVELRFTHTQGDFSEICFTNFLPRVREKGLVTITDVTRDNRVLHSSTHNC